MKCRYLLCFLYCYALCAAEESPDCDKGPKPTRVYLRHIEAKGIGYKEGYSTLEFFFMPFEPWHDVWTPFLDLRGHEFNNRRMAANVGIGMRCLSSCVWGFNAYWDYRKTHRHSYNQVTLGVESLGEVFDFRMNGYISAGVARSRFFDTKLDRDEGGFQVFSHKREFSLQGANAEMGVHFDRFEHMPLYFAAGPYYLIGSRHAAWGGEARAVLTVFDYFAIEGSTSYDHLFKWIGQGQISLIIPFGKRRSVRPSQEQSCSKAQTLAKRMVQRIDRNEIIPVHDKHKETTKRDRLN